MKRLMVLTSRDQFGNTGRKTGFWLEEFAASYFVFQDAGVQLKLASPEGRQPPIHPKSRRYGRSLLCRDDCRSARPHAGGTGSAKTATTPVEQPPQVFDSSNGRRPVFGRTQAKNVLARPRRKTNLFVMPALAAPAKTTVQINPTRKLTHDFRNTVQELVYAVERVDRAAVAGLADSLDGYLLEALYGPKQIA